MIIIKIQEFSFLAIVSKFSSRTFCICVLNKKYVPNMFWFLMMGRYLVDRNQQNTFKSYWNKIQNTLHIV